MHKTKQITATALLVVIAAVVALILYLIPFLQGIIFVVGIPLIMIGVKYDIKYHLLGLLVLTILLATFDPIYSVMILLLIGPMSLLQGYVLKHKQAHSTAIITGAVGFVFGLLALLFIAKSLFAVDFIHDIEVYSDSMINEMEEVYSSSELIPEEDLDDLMMYFGNFKQTIMMLMPSFIALFGLISSALSMGFSKIIFKRVGISLEKRYFKDFRIDKEKRLYLLIIIGIVLVAAMLDSVNMDYYVINCTSILFLVFQINGAALIWYLTDQHPNKTALRVIFILLYIASPVLPIAEMIVRYGLALVGFADMYGDFRTRITKKQQP